MYHKSFIFPIFAGMLLIPTACTNNTDWDNRDTRVATLTLTSQIVSTRCLNSSLQGTQIAKGAKIGVLAYDNNISVVNNHPLEADGKGILTGDAISISYSTSSATITAYAPYNNKWTLESSSYNFNISTDQSTEEGYLESDLLWGQVQNVNLSEETKANITFCHKLSKLLVTLSKDDASTLSLKDAEVSILGVKDQITFTPTTGVLGEASNSTTNILIAKLSDEKTANMAAILIPQTVSSKHYFFKIKLASGKVFYAKLNKSCTLESGKAYKISVSLETSNEENITVNIKEENEINGLLG